LLLAGNEQVSLRAALSHDLFRAVAFPFSELLLLSRVVVEKTGSLLRLGRPVLLVRQVVRGRLYPGVLHSGAGREPSFRIDLEALLKEVQEVRIFTGDSFLESSRAGDSEDAEFLVLDQERRVVSVEVVVLLSALVDHSLRRHPSQLHDKFELLLLVITWEEWLSGVKLCQDAAETPNVDLLAVFDPQDHFRGAVEPRLHVGVDLLVSKAARSEVHDLQLAAHRVHAQDVLWLEITVDDLVLFKEHKSLQDLHCVVADLVG